MSNIFCQSKNYYNKLKWSFSDHSDHLEKYVRIVAQINPEETFNGLQNTQVVHT